MLDLGEEPALGDGRLLGRAVPGVEQALEHDPAPAQVVVHSQVDPAEAAVGQAAEHLVLPGDQLSGRQLGSERELGAAVRAVPFGKPGPSVPAAPDRALAGSAEPLALGHLRVGQDRARRVTGRDRRDLDQPGA